jgi:Tol biopolymer transport system component
MKDHAQIRRLLEVRQTMAGRVDASAWSRIESVLAAALELPHDARDAFVEHACVGDAVLQAEVAALLAASERDSPVDAPVATVRAVLADRDPAATVPHLEPGSRLGPYVIVSPLGAGGMGQVYRARDSRLDRDVAVKIVAPHLRPDATSRARLEREARVIASLSHPNVVAIFDIGEHDDMVYVVTELLTGLTLRNILQSGPVDERTIVDYATQIARGLGAAHARHVVHRDLKPENLFVTHDDIVKILDFGLAKPHVDHAKGATQSLTSVHAILGTIGYMSPEQITGDDVDERSDLFSLGAVLYEAATGTPAFDGATRSEIAAAILGTPPIGELSRVSPALGQTITRCLARSPADRYQTAADLAFTLQLLTTSTSRSEVERRSRTTRPRWRQTTRMTAAVAGVGALAIVAGVLMQRSTPIADRKPITFVMHAPKGAAFEEVTMEPRPAVSPDGRRLAFRARIGSQSMLFVQTLGALEAQPVVPMAGTFPFWSPDGEFIAFGTSERLERVFASGKRAPQVVCMCNAQWGGAWAGDGTILFAGSAGLFRVSSEDGQPQQMTHLDQSRAESSHRFPVLLPGGKRFLYLIRSARDDARGVFLGSFDEPDLKKRVIAEDSNVTHIAASDGSSYLLFVRDRTLLAQRFDTDRGSLVSDPVVVSRPVVPGEGGRFAPFAAGGTTLVYRLRSNSRTPLQWVSRDGVSAGRIGNPDGSYRYPSLSPDGTKLAVVLGDAETDKSDVWVIDLARQTNERLTNDPVGAFYPHWMPDGQHIVFASARGGQWRTYRQSITENHDTPLDSDRDPFGQYPTAITRDGRFIVAEQGQTGVWLLPLMPGTSPQRLLDGWHGRVSPDGRWIAYTAEGTGVPEVYVTSFPVPSTRWRISTNGGVDPQWRQDGRELYYVAGHNTLMAVPVRTGASFEFGRTQPLFPILPDTADLGGLGAIYAPAPDGQRFVVTESRSAQSPVGVEEMLLTVTMNWSPSTH